MDVSTPGDIRNSVSVVEPYSPLTIGIVGTSPTFGLNLNQEVGHKRQSTSPGLIGQYQKLDATVDGKFPDDLNSTSFFSKLIGHKLSGVSSGDLYM